MQVRNVTRHKSGDASLISAIREISKDRISLYCAMKINAEDCAEHSHEYDHMSCILLWGQFGQLILRVYYGSDLAKKWASECLQDENCSAESQTDFFNEFCNLLGGQIRGHLEENLVLTGMSLPFSSSGSDEKYYQRLHADSNLSLDSWLLTSDEGEAKVSCEIVIDDRDKFREIKKLLVSNDLRSDEDGEVEFF